MSIFLLLAIGMKAGVELARYPLLDVAMPALIVVMAGALIPLAAYPVLRRISAARMAHPKIFAAITTHLGFGKGKNLPIF